MFFEFQFLQYSFYPLNSISESQAKLTSNIFETSIGESSLHNTSPREISISVSRVIEID